MTDSLAIVVPVVNCLVYTRQLVSSIQTRRPVEVILIDNASTDGTATWAVEHPATRRRYVRNTVNLGVAASWNLGIRLAWKLGHAAALVLNNDLVLAADTIDAICTWQQSGLTFPTIFTPRIRPVQLASYPRRRDFTLPCNYAGFLMTRGVIDRIGWFDEAFWPAYWEDRDFDVRLEAAGVRRGACRDALAVHYASRTIAEGGVSNEHFQANRMRFFAKHPRAEIGTSKKNP